MHSFAPKRLLLLSLPLLIGAAILGAILLAARNHAPANPPAGTPSPATPTADQSFWRPTPTAQAGSHFPEPGTPRPPALGGGSLAGESAVTPPASSGAAQPTFDSSATTPTGQPDPPGTLVPTPQFSLAGMTLSIPRIGVSAAVVEVPLSGSTWDVTALGSHVGHLWGTAYPGHGNAALAGHVDFGDGSPGPFARLGELYPGDTITLHQNGVEATFEVATIQTVHRFAVEALFPTDDVWLTLITCSRYDAGLGEYAERLVVVAFPTE